MTNDQSDKTFHPNRRGFLGVAAATGKEEAVIPAEKTLGFTTTAAATVK